MPYTKTALNKFKKEQVISLYIEDQKNWIEESKKHVETVKQLMIQKAQAENSYKLLSDKYDVDLRESCNGYRAKINQLEKENKELKSNIDSNSPNNKALIKNLQHIIENLKEQLEKVKQEHIHFNTIWKTEGITEQDIIDMKRQISDQCDIIRDLKYELETINEETGRDAENMKKLYDENVLLKQEHKELTQKQEYYYKLINQIKPLTDEMFDSL